MKFSNTKSIPKYIILKSRKNKNLFFSTNNHEDQRYSAKGELWYDVIGFAETVEEAQGKIEAIEGPVIAIKKYLALLSDMISKTSFVE